LTTFAKLSFNNQSGPRLCRDVTASRQAPVMPGLPIIFLLPQ